MALSWLVILKASLTMENILTACRLTDEVKQSFICRLR